MEPEFWHDRWSTGHIGFHQPIVARPLERHWPELGLNHGSRVFVPLCGKSLDLLWLRDLGHSVIGVELSSIALEAFCLENGVPARRRSHGPLETYEAAQLSMICGDLFSLERSTLGDVAAVYDRAALVSWNDSLRERYVAQMTALTRPGTETLLITMEYAQAEMPGPPFSISGADVESLYGPHHDISELSRHDILENEARMRSRGVTRLHEVCYRLTRK